MQQFSIAIEVKVSYIFPLCRTHGLRSLPVLIFRIPAWVSGRHEGHTLLTCPLLGSEENLLRSSQQNLPRVSLVGTKSHAHPKPTTGKGN